MQGLIPNNEALKKKKKTLSFWWISHTYCTDTLYTNKYNDQWANTPASEHNIEELFKPEFTERVLLFTIKYCKMFSSALVLLTC